MNEFAYSASRPRRVSPEERNVEGVLDVHRDLYPFSIVWCPIPLLTWILPFVGHMGIADSRGVIYDFAGPYCIGEGDFAFGRPTRYLQLSPSKVSAYSPNAAATLEDSQTAQLIAYNDAIDVGNSIYCKRMHNLM